MLEALVVATGVWCLVACHTWQSRLCWSFARDGGVPMSKVLARVEKGKGMDVPIAAHGVSSFLVALLGLLYLGSSTAFYSMVTACIVLLYISYAIPIICLLLRGRGNIKRGPFWCGVWGMVANWVVLAWTLVTLVMYSFPVYYPAEAGSELAHFSYLSSRGLGDSERMIRPSWVRGRLGETMGGRRVSSFHANEFGSYELRLRRLRHPRNHHRARLVPESEETLQRTDCTASRRCC